jgi:CRP/FNR family transcriptional regulator
MTKPACIAPAALSAETVINISDLRIRCSRCSLRELCLPGGLDANAMRRIDELVTTRRRLKRGEVLYRAADVFTALYAIRVGTCKTTVLASEGREQITGYQMTGDLLGFDGISMGRHQCDAVALEDTEACVIPFGRLEEIARAVSPVQHNLHQMLSREITDDHKLMLALGRLRAEERVAAFLVNLAERFRARGYAPTEFVLRMTRAEIGNYLGLTLETVSRLFSRLQADGLLEVHGRVIKHLDVEALRKRTGHPC